jgi:circadian clock protein KaiB
VRLRLYVAGDAPHSVTARANLARVLAETRIRVHVELIDVFAEPSRALRDGILVTPTLVRVAPAPLRQIIGDLRDRDAVIAVLDVEDAR